MLLVRANPLDNIGLRGIRAARFAQQSSKCC